MEIVNTDLQPLINSLGNIENLLRVERPSPFIQDNLKQVDQPTENLEDQPTENLEDQPTENLEENTGFIAPTLETDDLDLLLYENPNLFK